MNGPLCGPFCACVWVGAAWAVKPLPVRLLFGTVGWVSTPSNQRVPVLPARLRHLAWFYVVGVAALLPWVTYLGISLPDHSVAQHWDVTWVGLDVAILAAVAWTAWFVWQRDSRLVVPASVTAALLLVDAWVDVMTASRPDLFQAIVLACVIEIPAAILSLGLAWRVLAAHEHPPTI